MRHYKHCVEWLNFSTRMACTNLEVIFHLKLVVYHLSENVT